MKNEKWEKIEKKNLKWSRKSSYVEIRGHKDFVKTAITFDISHLAINVSIVPAIWDQMAKLTWILALDYHLFALQKNHWKS